MPPSDLVGRTVGPYRIDERLGAGAMGEVFRAYDAKLDRPVALKVLPGDTASDPNRLRRFHDEARAASSLNHPHILVIHDFGDVDGRPFIVTELVEGETVRQRLARGPMSVDETLRLARQIADALGAAHRRGIVHRDVKPENVMIRTDGYAKVLDFGLAKLTSSDVAIEETRWTQPGAIVGTPRYMSPEQIRGLPADPRADVWALGVLIYEMLAGAPAFQGRSFADVAAAIIGTEPVRLDERVGTVSAAVADVVHTAMRKEAPQRYASAADMAAALETAATSAPSAMRRNTRRIIVLPFRILTPHPDSDFLAFSLPDAITSTLASLESFVVRSSVIAARYANATDLVRVAAEAAVDVVLSGTLLRVGDRVRITTQLVEAPSGVVVWSRTSDATLDDVFALQDATTTTIVDSLSVPLTGRDREQLRRGAPVSPRAYECYLRANELSRGPKTWRPSRDMYLEAVRLEPRYAPAWARLARVYRLIAKYQEDGSGTTPSLAIDALDRALALDPDLAAAHHLYAQIDVDRGRAEDALIRLLERARARPGDADIFAALVHVCRVCGLMDASLVADARARSIDPAVDTGVMHTYWLLNRYADVVRTAGDVKAYVAPAALVELGQIDAARAMLDAIEAQLGNRTPYFASAVRAFIDGRHADGVAALIAQATSGLAADPETFLYVARHLAHVGEEDRGMAYVATAVDAGYFCYPVLVHDSWLAGVRARPDFQALLPAVKARWERAAAMFSESGGPDLLDVRSIA